SNLNFHPLSVLGHDCGVKRFVPDRLGCTDPVAKPVGIRRVKICHNRIDLPADRFFRFRWRVYNDPYREQVVHLFERNVLTPHLIPYRVDRLRSSRDLKLESLPFKFIFDWLDELPHQLRPCCFCRVDLLRDIGIHLEVGKTQVQVFQLCLDRIKSQTVRKRRVQINGLRSNFELLVSRHAVERSHIVQAICQLYEDHPDIVGQCEEHFAEILRLLRRAVLEYAANLGETVDDARYLGTEDPFNVLELYVGVLHYIVEQGRNNGSGSEAHFFHADLRYGQGVKDERFTRLPPHILVSFERNGEGPLDKLRVALIQDRFSFSE